MKWFRLYHDLPNDRKLRRFSTEHKWAWVVLLCLASESQKRGYVLGEDAADIADYCGFECVQDYQFFLDKLRQKDMITPVEGGFQITNWEARQYTKPSDLPENTRHRKRKQREKQKELTPEVSRVTLRDESVMSRHPDTDTETETDSETEAEHKNKAVSLMDNFQNRSQWTRYAAEHLRGSFPPPVALPTDLWEHWTGAQRYNAWTEPLLEAVSCYLKGLEKPHSRANALTYLQNAVRSENFAAIAARASEIISPAATDAPVKAPWSVQTEYHMTGGDGTALLRQYDGDERFLEIAYWLGEHDPEALERFYAAD
ncbi:MAG: hypothetical protein DDT26_00119 [Dehalococcoidia bacterium]|nr:hypothetical protein [Chloroflexota bacterium]